MNEVSRPLPKVAAPRSSPDNLAYLLNTPIVRWQASKALRTVETLREEAEKRGMVLRAPFAVNNDRYTLSQRGQDLKVGSLNVIAWFLLKS
jgi:hypothetical protein